MELDTLFKNTLFFHLFVTIVIVYIKMNATKYGT